MNKNIFIPVTTNASISEFASEIISIIRSNLTPGKLREAIGEYHEKTLPLRLPRLPKRSVSVYSALCSRRILLMFWNMRNTMILILNY